MRKSTITFLIIAFFIPLFGFANTKSNKKSSTLAKPNFFQLAAENIQGQATLFSEYQGKTILVVNTASQCGYTSQYKGLESLYQKYKSKGLVVLGFPSNDFGGQEPGSNKDIKKFCELKFKVSFPMFAKVNITSAPQSSVYEFLTKTNPNAATRKTPNWNFNKYLINKKGEVTHHFASSVDPEAKELTAAIESLLALKK